MTKLPEPVEPASTETPYDKLCAAAAQLRKTERGMKALQNLERFMSEGGIGLDATNKRAALALFIATLNNPWDLPSELTKGGAR